MTAPMRRFDVIYIFVARSCSDESLSCDQWMPSPHAYLGCSCDAAVHLAFQEERVFKWILPDIQNERQNKHCWTSLTWHCKTNSLHLQAQMCIDAVIMHSIVQVYCGHVKMPLLQKMCWSSSGWEEHSCFWRLCIQANTPLQHLSKSDALVEGQCSNMYPPHSVRALSQERSTPRLLTIIMLSAFKQTTSTMTSNGCRRKTPEELWIKTDNTELIYKHWAPSSHKRYKFSWKQV